MSNKDEFVNVLSVHVCALKSEFGSGAYNTLTFVDGVEGLSDDEYLLSLLLLHKRISDEFELFCKKQNISPLGVTKLLKDVREIDKCLNGSN